MTLVCVQASQWKTSPPMKVHNITIQKLLKLNVLKIPKAKRIVIKVSTTCGHPSAGPRRCHCTDTLPLLYPYKIDGTLVPNIFILGFCTVAHASLQSNFNFIFKFIVFNNFTFKKI